jgi:hypothetical protein
MVSVEVLRKVSGPGFGLMTARSQSDECKNFYQPNFRVCPPIPKAFPLFINTRVGHQRIKMYLTG